MVVHINSLQNLKSYKPDAKFIDAPLASKGYFLRLEQPVQEVLERMTSAERTAFIRCAIGAALVRDGLLLLPEKGEKK